MRLVLHMRAKSGGIVVPVHYNRLLQGLIYRHLDEAVAQRVHQQGWAVGKRRLRLFVFSRLFGRARYDRATARLHFAGRVTWSIASPVDALLESLALHLVRQGEVTLGRQPVVLDSVEVALPPVYRRPVRLKALSPITVYSTLEAPDGRKKTYYYAPQEPEFGRLVLDNLRRKIRAWTGEDLPPDGASFRPVKVSNRNLVVARYKGTIVKGWTGIYELDAPEPYFRMALDAGLGAKNSQGFGFVEVWGPRKTSHGGTEGAGKKGL